MVRIPKYFTINMLRAAKTKFVIPIMYAPVLGFIGKAPFVSFCRPIRRVVANILTGPIPVN